MVLSAYCDDILICLSLQPNCTKEDLEPYEFDLEVPPLPFLFIFLLS